MLYKIILETGFTKEDQKLSGWHRTIEEAYQTVKDLWFKSGKLFKSDLSERQMTLKGVNDAGYSATVIIRGYVFETYRYEVKARDQFYNLLTITLSIEAIGTKEARDHIKKTIKAQGLTYVNMERLC